MTPQNKIKDALRCGTELTYNNLTDITGLAPNRIDGGMDGILKQGFAKVTKNGFIITLGQRILDVLDKSGPLNKDSLMFELEIKIQDWPPYDRAMNTLKGHKGVKLIDGVYTSRNWRAKGE